MSRATSGRPIHAAIISPQEVVTRGLTAMLADYPDRVLVTVLPGTRVERVDADVILYDTFGLDKEPGEALEHLIRHTRAKILLYSRVMRPDLRARGQAMGCVAWVSMSSSAGELVDAVERAANGELPANPEERLGREVGLTVREVEVLTLIAHGLSNEEIADRLFLTINTLKTHIRQTYRRIGVHSRAQAVGWALQHGFAPGTPPEE